MPFRLFLLGLTVSLPLFSRPIVVGSKSFTEGHILAELTAQKLEQGGFSVERRFGMGGTGILFEALSSGAIDIYPEYTGTIARAILDDSSTDSDHNVVHQKLLKKGLTITKGFGFNNTYALAVKREKGLELAISTISDLKNHPYLQAAFSHEFFNRADGYRGLQQTYGLDFHRTTGIEHALAYEAIDQGKIDVTDIYSTDAKVKTLGLAVLEDDLAFFPEYLPVAMAKEDFKEAFPRAWELVTELEATITTDKMIELNSRVDIDKVSPGEAVNEFLRPNSSFQPKTLFSRVARRAKEHILLVVAAVLVSFVIGFPLGILAANKEALGRPILHGASIVQTIPSLALLCFLIPLFGIGEGPALIALALYGLLPIVINTYTGLVSIDKEYREISRALGLSRWESLLYTEIPMASPAIFAGLKTSVIIGIGTATLSALIGAGGHGVPIMRGLSLNDTATILEGAVPAALLSLAANFALERIGRIFIPTSLRGNEINPF